MTGLFMEAGWRTGWHTACDRRASHHGENWGWWPSGRVQKEMVTMRNGALGSQTAAPAGSLLGHLIMLPFPLSSTAFQSFKSHCLQGWHLMPGTRRYVRKWTSWPMKELKLVGKAAKMAGGAVLQKDNHIPPPINHKESGLRLWFRACLLLVFKYLLSYNATWMKTGYLKWPDLSPGKQGRRQKRRNAIISL